MLFLVINVRNRNITKRQWSKIGAQRVTGHSLILSTNHVKGWNSLHPKRCVFLLLGQYPSLHYNESLCSEQQFASRTWITQGSKCPLCPTFSFMSTIEKYWTKLFLGVKCPSFLLCFDSTTGHSGRRNALFLHRWISLSFSCQRYVMNRILFSVWSDEWPHDSHYQSNEPDFVAHSASSPPPPLPSLHLQIIRHSSLDFSSIHSCLLRVTRRYHDTRSTDPDIIALMTSRRSLK